MPPSPRLFREDCDADWFRRGVIMRGPGAFVRALQPLLRFGLVIALSTCIVFSAEASEKKSSRDHLFRDFIASLWPLAEPRGVSRETFDRAFAGVDFDPAVVADATRQAEFSRAIWDYIATAVSPSRVKRGRD